MMRSAVAAGLDIIATWEAFTSTVRAPARAAMKRCAAAGIRLSLRATRVQDGIVRHAGGPEGWPRVCTSAGRWVAAITLVVLAGRSPAKMSRNRAVLT